MSRPNYLVEVEDLYKSYSKPVLCIDKLRLEQAKIYGIIGPSGAGKSTFLRILNLLTEPDRGRIIFNGQTIYPKNGNVRLDLYRQMTLMFQKPVLYKTSVRENIAYGLKVRGMNKQEIQRRVDDILKKTGMEELGHRYAGTLSGGEAQRVALARAVVFEPRLLLLDEPTANLDPSNVELMEKLILDLNRSMGITIVIVTHNIFQARRIADEVLFLFEGRIVERGQTEQIFTTPR
ncbi:MAG TPA: phosphate ABC transporter ATP-binding protein, partial [Firmicutes bacterium]|nr:phosphate ABC transporter ATP-binding protein [Bacillota bacterium]